MPILVPTKYYNWNCNGYEYYTDTKNPYVGQKLYNIDNTYSYCNIDSINADNTINVSDFDKSITTIKDKNSNDVNIAELVTLTTSEHSFASTSSLHKDLYGHIEFTNLATIDEDDSQHAFLGAFSGNRGIISVSFPSLTTINAESGIYYTFLRAFEKCGCLQKVNFDNLVNTTEDFGDAFVDCLNLREVSFRSLQSGDFDGSFSGCSNLTTVDLSNLTTIFGSIPFSGSFENCISLKTISFPKLANYTGTRTAFYETFKGCKFLEDIYFPSVNSAFFTSNNIFRHMLTNTGTECVHRLHFPPNVQTNVESLNGFSTNFGAEDGYLQIVYDQPATE